MKRLKFVSLSLALVSALSLSSLTVQATDTYGISGNISPDIVYTEGFEANANSGFHVRLIGTPYYTFTDSYGNFNLRGIPSGTYDLQINKNGFLPRTLTNVVITSGSIHVSDISQSSLTIWAGDVTYDNAINIADHMEQAKYFNTAVGDLNYDEKCDFNRDGAINLADLMSLYRHQIASPSDYPGFVQW